MELTITVAKHSGFPAPSYRNESANVGSAWRTKVSEDWGNQCFNTTVCRTSRHQWTVDRYEAGFECLWRDTSE